jgi:hypothetical protein
MSLVNVTNVAVSEQLQRNDSLTIPDGEVWRVNVSMGTRERDGSKMLTFTVNNEPAMSIGARDGSDYQSNGTTTCDMVFVGGDTLTCEEDSADNNDVGVQIGGWKVKT